MHDQTLLIIVLVMVVIATTVQAVALVSTLLAVRRLEARFGAAADIERTLDLLRGIARVAVLVLVKPLRPLGAALALWKGLRSGVDAYRQLRPAAARAASPPAALR